MATLVDGAGFPFPTAAGVLGKPSRAELRGGAGGRFEPVAGGWVRRQRCGV